MIGTPACKGCMISGHPHLEDCPEASHNKYRMPPPTPIPSVGEWIMGIPDPAKVKSHESDHPRPDGYREDNISVSRTETPGGVYVECDGRSFGEWVCIHPKRPIEPYVSILRLKEVNGEVLMQLGFTSWLPLSQTRWAAGCEFYPVGQNGLPLDASSCRREIEQDKHAVECDAVKLTPTSLALPDTFGVGPQPDVEAMFDVINLRKIIADKKQEIARYHTTLAAENLKRLQAEQRADAIARENIKHRTALEAAKVIIVEDSEIHLRCHSLDGDLATMNEEERGVYNEYVAALAQIETALNQ